MSEFTDLLERARDRFPAPEMPVERVILRRERHARNQRIAAGVVGVAVFVAAIWIVTSVGSLDRSEKSVGPAGTGPAVTAPPSAPASAAPDVVERGMCSDGAGSRLELTDMGPRTEVRFEVYRSPLGHEWRIVLSHLPIPSPGEFFRGTTVASDNGVLGVTRRFRPIPEWTIGDLSHFEPDRIWAKARDTQTDQVCKVDATISHVSG
jgi:hypothetical protein